MSRGRREWLLVKAPSVSEARFEIGPALLDIGRDPANRVVLRDTFVSAAHAEIVEHGGERCVRDLGSRNGTRLNGRALAPRTLHALQDGDVLRIGPCELTYRCDPKSDGVAERPGAPPGDEVPTRQGSRPRRGREPAPTALPFPVAAHPAAAPPAAPLAVLPAPAPHARRRRWGRVGRIVLALLLGGLAATGIVAGVLLLLAPPRVALLVLGGDARPDELRRGQQGRTDTLLTVVADRAPAGVALISIPRDLWVEIPGFGEERINAAYALGGPQAAERAVSEVLGVRVDRYLFIGLQGVRDVVDAAGGVEIDVARSIHDDAYPTDDYGTIVVDIPAGRQRMDGETALRYARTRHQDTDFGRIARQQQLVVALRNALLQPGTWPRLPAVIGAVRRATRTDLGPLELTTLGVALIGGPAQPDRLAVDLSLVDEFFGADGAFLLRPRPALRQRVAAFLTPANAAVEVLNGTRTEGLAQQAADRLRGRGMRIARLGNAAALQTATTVEVRPGLRRAGVYAASTLDLPPDAVQESPNLAEGIDVRIILGDGR